MEDQGLFHAFLTSQNLERELLLLIIIPISQVNLPMNLVVIIS